MKKLISVKLAGNLLLLATGVLLIFHLLVIANVIPPNIVWGGRIGNTSTNLIVLEVIAIAVTILFASLIAIKTGYAKGAKFQKVASIGMWLIFVFLILNTVGNLASGVSAEKFLFAPLTAILAVLALRVAIEKK